MCTGLADLQASEDRLISTSCLVTGALGLQTSATIPGFYVGIGDETQVLMFTHKLSPTEHSPAQVSMLGFKWLLTLLPSEHSHSLFSIICTREGQASGMHGRRTEWMHWDGCSRGDSRYLLLVELKNNVDGACGSSNRRDAHTVRSEGRQSKAAWLSPWTSFYLGPWWKVPSTLQESLLPSVNPSWRALMYPPTGMSLQCSQILSNQQPTLATIVLVT